MEVNDDGATWADDGALRSHALSVLRAQTEPATSERPLPTAPAACASPSILSALYWVHRQAYGGPLATGSKGWFAKSDWSTELSPRPVTNALNPVPAKPLKLAYAHPTDPEWVGVPRFWGLQTLGVPREDRRTLGADMRPEARVLARALRPVQEQALTAILKSLQTCGGAFVQADCGA